MRGRITQGKSRTLGMLVGMVLFLGWVAVPGVRSELIDPKGNPAEKLKLYSIQISTIRVELNDENRFGIELSTDVLEKRLRKNPSIAAFSKELGGYGEVVLVSQSEGSGFVGATNRISSGSDSSYVTVFQAKSSSGAGERSYSQSQISSGVNMEITLNDGDTGQQVVTYSVRMDDVFPVVYQPSKDMDPMNLVDRNRVEWTGNDVISDSGDVLVLKSLRTNKQRGQQYILVVQVTPAETARDAASEKKQ